MSSSAQSDPEGGLSRRKIRKNPKYIQDVELNSNPLTPTRKINKLGVTSQKTSQKYTDIESSDEEEVPRVPKIKKSGENIQRLRLSATPRSFPYVEDVDRTLMAEEAEEPVYTFKSLYKSVKRLECKYLCRKFLHLQCLMLF